jgi:hypothetical protein
MYRVLAVLLLCRIMAVSRKAYNRDRIFAHKPRSRILIQKLRPTSHIVQVLGVYITVKNRVFL